jgi:hypothetical protein
MTLSPVPASSASDGRHKIWFVPYAANTDPTSAAVLIADSTKDVTYSFTPDGFNHSVSEASIPDKRYTLDQDLSQPGRTTETLELKYVDSTDPGSASVTFTKGTSGWFVRRKYLDNAIEPKKDQIVDVFTVTVGAQRPDAPDENGLDTTTQGAYITARTQPKVKLVV